MNRILVIGDSLFAATLLSMLSATFAHATIEAVPDIACALALSGASQFDVAILADTMNTALPPESVDLIGGNLPMLIHTSLQQDFLGVFLYQKVKAGATDLIAVLDLVGQVDRTAGAKECLQMCQNSVEGESS